MRQRKTTTSRSERLFLLILSLITLSGLALYAFAPHSSPAPQPMQATEAGSTSESNAPEGQQPHRDSLIRDPHYVGRQQEQQRVGRSSPTTSALTSTALTR